MVQGAITRMHDHFTGHTSNDGRGAVLQCKMIVAFGGMLQGLAAGKELLTGHNTLLSRGVYSELP